MKLIKLEYHKKQRGPMGLGGNGYHRGERVAAKEALGSSSFADFLSLVFSSIGLEK